MKKISGICFIIFLFTGCASQVPQVKTGQGPAPAGEITQDWSGADIKSLPVSNNPEVLAEIARDICLRSSPAGQKEYALRLAAHAHELDKKNKNVALILSRVAFFVADSIDGDDSRMIKNADIGVNAARIVGVTDANPEACYYFALNMGLIVQTKGLLAIGKLPEIVNTLKIAQKMEHLECGGPKRVLGMLYLKAPAWPTGIGDLDKSLELLKQAVEKYPCHPQNFMFYAEALIEDENNNKALENLDIAYRLAVPEIWGVYYSKKWRKEIEALRKKIAK